MKNQMSVADISGGYRYGFLDPRPGADNGGLLGARTIGIEVTVPEFAAGCGLGNLDPQHGEGDVSRAAIEAAVEVPLPPRESRLVTVRPDVDSCGAMAVLALRRAGVALGRGTRSRVDVVARADRFDRGRWPGVRPLPCAVEDLETKVSDGAALAAIRGACFDHEPSATDKVEVMIRWLLDGEEPPRYRQAWRAQQEDLIGALRRGEIRLESRFAGSVAVLETVRTDALDLGYRLAPVVVARNPAFRWRGTGNPHQRYAVAQWELGWIDMIKVRQELTRLEPGWGGSPTIIGSPQGKGSTLSLENVLTAVSRCLSPGAGLRRQHQTLPGHEISTPAGG